MREKANTVLLLLEPPSFVVSSVRSSNPPFRPDPAPSPRTLPLPTWSRATRLVGWWPPGFRLGGPRRRRGGDRRRARGCGAGSLGAGRPREGERSCSSSNRSRWPRGSRAAAGVPSSRGARHGRQRRDGGADPHAGAHLQLQGGVHHPPPPGRHLRPQPGRAPRQPGLLQRAPGGRRLVLRPRHRQVRRPRGPRLPPLRRRGRGGRRRGHPLHPRLLRRRAGAGPVPGRPLLPRRQLRALLLQHEDLRPAVPPARPAQQRRRRRVRQLPPRARAPVPVPLRRRLGRAQVGHVAAVPPQRGRRAPARLPLRGQLRRQHSAPRRRARRRRGHRHRRQHPAQRNVRRQRAHRLGAPPRRQVLRHAAGQGLVLEGVPARGRRPGPPLLQPLRAQRPAPPGAPLHQEEPHHRVGARPHLRPPAGLRRGAPGRRPRRQACVPREGHHWLLPLAQHGPLPRGHGRDRRLPPIKPLSS